MSENTKGENTKSRGRRVEKPDPVRRPSVDLKLMVQADKKAREARVQEAIQKILEKERCVMDVAMVLRNGQVITQLSIVAQD